MHEHVHSSDLPSPLRGVDEDSFVHHTIVTRWPRIAGRVIEENDFPASVNDRIQALRDEIPDGPIRHIGDAGAPDEALWAEYVAPHQGKSWLQAPWLFGEFYFYRRILEATGYFQTGPGRGKDPFEYQKRQGFDQSTATIRALAERRMDAPDHSADERSLLARLLRTALWGNQADLSMWAADEDAPSHLGTGREDTHLLVNDTAAALDHLGTLNRPARVDVWADNAGFELVSDLALVDGLLATERVDRVVVHLKVHPTFVSDATVGDVHGTLKTLAESEQAAVRGWAARLRTAIGEGRLRLRDDWVWTSPVRGRELPPHIRAELARSDLLISKGDANYRRLLGDRAWSFTTPFRDAAAPLPAPVFALRTLKSEVAAGLSPEQVERLWEYDPDWLIDGEWGVIQFAPAHGPGESPTEN